MKKKCHFTGCKETPVNKVTANWRKGFTFHTCAEHTPGHNRLQAYTIEPLAPPVQLAMVYGGGSIQYFGGHHLPQLTVTLWKTTTYGELWKELKNELACIGESFEQYKDSEIEAAMDYFYQEDIKGRTSKAFARFSREERAGMEECGEGSAYVFVFGRIERSGPFGHTYVVYP